MNAQRQALSVGVYSDPVATSAFSTHALTPSGLFFSCEQALKQDKYTYKPLQAGDFVSARGEACTHAC